MQVTTCCGRMHVLVLALAISTVCTVYVHAQNWAGSIVSAAAAGRTDASEASLSSNVIKYEKYPCLEAITAGVRG